MTMQNHYIISCEHASHAIPEEWEHLFSDSGNVLESHHGWDPGALELAERMAEKLGANLHIYHWTRLLVEPNRSKGHKNLFSQYSKSLSGDQKSTVMEKYWSPFREKVRGEIEKTAASGKQVVHISVHSFTPVWEGKERDLDIGLLYDPQRKSEQEFCRNWEHILAGYLPEFRIRMNRPYLGSADGHTTSLRKEFSEENYLGIEIEVNQKYWFSGKSDWNSICEKIAKSLVDISKSV